jgi:cupin superfamily acireductone dioxygenase involved in methionine salvage
MSAKEKLNKNMINEAKAEFVLAKDLDDLRFRAPEEYNSIIQELSKKNGAAYVDMLSIFESESNGYIIGDDLMTEHVHPNLKGHRIMTRAFLDAIVDLKLLSSWRVDKKLSAESSDYPYTPFDSIIGSLYIQRLTKNWPFKPQYASAPIDSVSMTFQPATHVEAMSFKCFKDEIQWVEACNELYFYFIQNRQFNEALATAQALAQEFCHLERPQMMSAEVAYATNRRNLALYYLKKAYDINPKITTAKKIYQLYLMEDKFHEALQLLQNIKNQITDQAVEKQINALQQLQGYIHIDSVKDIGTLKMYCLAFAQLKRNDLADLCKDRIKKATMN